MRMRLAGVLRVNGCKFRAKLADLSKDYYCDATFFLFVNMTVDPDREKLIIIYWPVLQSFILRRSYFKSVKVIEV